MDMDKSFNLRSFFRMTTFFAWIIFIVQFALLVVEYVSSSLSSFPKWMKDDSSSILVCIVVFVALHFIKRGFSLLNLLIVRIVAKFSKKPVKERAKEALSEDFHTPYPLNFFWIVFSTVLAVILFFTVQPYAGWGSDPELTNFFVSGELLSYFATVLGIYRIVSRSWEDPLAKVFYIRNFANEKDSKIDIEEIFKEVERDLDLNDKDTNPDDSEKEEKPDANQSDKKRSKSNRFRKFFK